MKELEKHLLVGTRPTNLPKMPPTLYSTGTRVAKGVLIELAMNSSRGLPNS